MLKTCLDARRGHLAQQEDDGARQFRTLQEDVRYRILLTGVSQHFGNRRVRIRKLARQHLPENDAQTVDVAADVDVLRVHHLLRRHVRRRTDDHVGHRQRLLLELSLLGNAQIRKPRKSIRAKENVMRLDVAMDDTMALSLHQGVRDLTDQSDGLVHPKRALLEPEALHETVVQAAAGQVVHQHESEPGLGVASDLVDLDHVRMVNRHGDLRLAEKASDRIVMVLDFGFGEKDLSGEISARRLVVNEVNRAHTSAPQFLYDPKVTELSADFQHDVLQHETPSGLSREYDRHHDRGTEADEIGKYVLHIGYDTNNRAPCKCRAADLGQNSTKPPPVLVLIISDIPLA